MVCQPIQQRGFARPCEDAIAPSSPYSRCQPAQRQRPAIALISDHGDPAADIGREEAGGQNVYVRRVGEALAECGWQVDMFTRKASVEDAAIVQHTPHCRTIRLVAGPQEFIHRDQIFDYMPAFVESFKAFQRSEGVFYPLIHTNYWMSAWVGLQLKQQMEVQVVHTYHSLGAVKYQTIGNPPPIATTRLQVERDILEQGDCVVCTSPQEQRHVRSLVSTQGRIDVIPCGTDISNFRVIPKAEAKRQLGLKPSEPIVLYVGRFDPRKGIATLVHAFAQLQSRMEQPPGDTTSSPCHTTSPKRVCPKLVIVGGSDPHKPDGQERRRIEGLVNELGIAAQTMFVGQVGHDRLPLYYAAADVCVVPSHYEPFGLVAIEAMACGTPVVASNVGGLQFTVIPHQTGLLAPAQNASAFADAIHYILADDLRAHQLRQQAAQRVLDHFSWTGVATQLSALYEELLDEMVLSSRLEPFVALPQSSLTSPLSA